MLTCGSQGSALTDSTCGVRTRGPSASIPGVHLILLGVWGQFIFKFFNEIESNNWNRQAALDVTCLAFQLTVI